MGRMADSTERAVLTSTEAGKILSVSDETIRRYVSTGKLEGFTLPGGYYRVYRDSLDAMMSGS